MDESRVLYFIGRSKGKKKVSLDSIAEMGLTWKAIPSLKKRIMLDQQVLFSFLDISPRLIASNTHKKLNQTLTDRIIELAEFYAHGQEVFVTVENFNRWLSRPSVDLNGKKPTALMFSTHGLKEIRRVLNRIEYGIPL